MMQRIIELETEQAAKVQENRLLMLKYKQMDISPGPGMTGVGTMLTSSVSVIKGFKEDPLGKRKSSGKRFEMASIDSAIYSNNQQYTERRNSNRNSQINIKAPAVHGSVTGRSTKSKSSIGKLEPLNHPRNGSGVGSISILPKKKVFTTMDPQVPRS